MAMFGKQQFTATAAYDEKKSDSSNKKKDKGILNMPISTNIQISKKDKNMKVQEQAQNSFDPFDPFDPFPIRVGERVQVDEEGHIVAFGAEEEKKEEKVEEVASNVASNAQVIINPWDNLDNVPVVSIDEANKQAQAVNTATQPQNTVVNTVVKAEKPEITPDMLSQLANEIAPKMSKSLVDDITKEVTAKLSSQISQSIPVGSGDVKVVEPKITADALSEVVKQVTDSVSKTVNAQISAEIAKQLGGVSTSVSGIEKNVQGMVSGVSSDVTGKLDAGLNAINSDLSSKISATNDRIVAMSAAIEKNDNSAEFNKMSSIMSSISNQITSMKDIIEKPFNLTDEERDAKLKEAIEVEKNQLYRGLVIPILVSVVEARENMLRMAQVYKEKGTDVPSGVMKGYGLDLGDALEKNKVEIYQSKKGDKFDPKLHKKIGTASATKEDQDGQIATSLSCGYKYNGEVIFPEKVDVYLFKK